MKQLLLYATACATLLCTGCGTTSLYYESSARNIEPRQTVAVIPMVAEFEVISDKRIEPYVEKFDANTQGDISSLKNLAISGAAKKHSADAIIGGLVDVETDYYGNITITVTGYPARYVNFRSATKDDSWVLPFYLYQNTQPEEPKVVVKEKKRKLF